MTLDEGPQPLGLRPSIPQEGHDLLFRKRDAIYHSSAPCLPQVRLGQAVCLSQCVTGTGLRGTVPRGSHEEPVPGVQVPWEAAGPAPEEVELILIWK